jgi:hypothetical protein
MFQSHRRNEQILQKTEKYWKETTQKRLDCEKDQHNHFLGLQHRHIHEVVEMDLCCSVYLLIFPQNIYLPLSLLVYEFETGKDNVPVLKLHCFLLIND